MDGHYTLHKSFFLLQNFIYTISTTRIDSVKNVQPQCMFKKRDPGIPAINCPVCCSSTENVHNSSIGRHESFPSGSLLVLVAFPILYNNTVVVNGAVTILSHDCTTSRKASKSMEWWNICKIATFFCQSLVTQKRQLALQQKF